MTPANVLFPNKVSTQARGLNSTPGKLQEFAPTTHFTEFTFFGWGSRGGTWRLVSPRRVLLTYWLMFLSVSAITGFVFIDLLCV